MQIIEAADYDLNKVRTWPVVGPLEKTAKLTLDDYMSSGGTFPGDTNRWKLYHNDGTKGIGNILVGVILTKDDSKDLYLAYNPEYIKHRLIKKNFESGFIYDPEIDDQNKLEGFKTRGGDYLIGPSIEHIASSIDEPTRDFTKEIEDTKETAKATVFASFAVVRFEDGQFAAVQRNDGKIAFPGGKVEEGERAVDAAIREAHEEGWDVEAIDSEPFFQKNVDGKLIVWFRAKNAKQISSTDKSQPIVVKKEQLASFNNEEAIYTLEYYFPFIEKPKVQEPAKVQKVQVKAPRPSRDEQDLISRPDRQEFIKSQIAKEDLENLINFYPVKSIAAQNGLTELEIKWLANQYGIKFRVGRKTGVSKTGQEQTASKESLAKDPKRMTYLTNTFPKDKIYDVIARIKDKELTIAETSAEFNIPEHEIKYLILKHMSAIKFIELKVASVDFKDKFILIKTTIKSGDETLEGYIRYGKDGSLLTDFDNNSEIASKTINAMPKNEFEKLVKLLTIAARRYFK